MCNPHRYTSNLRRTIALRRPRGVIATTVGADRIADIGTALAGITVATVMTAGIVADKRPGS
jgi:hypothetical protein